MKEVEPLTLKYSLLLPEAGAVVFCLALDIDSPSPTDNGVVASILDKDQGIVGASHLGSDYLTLNYNR